VLFDILYKRRESLNMAADSSGFRLKIFGVELGLLGQVGVALILAIITGLWIKSNPDGYIKADTFAFLNDIFLALIKMVVPPLIFCALASGAMNLGGGADARRVVTKSLLLFLSTAAIAVSVGASCGAFIKPGDGLQDPAKATAQVTSQTSSTPSAPAKVDTDSLKKKADDFTLKPMNPIKAMAEERYIQIIYFAFFTGLVINYVRNSSDAKRESLLKKINELEAISLSEEKALAYVHKLHQDFENKVTFFGKLFQPLLGTPYEQEVLQKAMASQSDAMKYVQDALKNTKKDSEDQFSLKEKASGAAKIITDFTPIIFKMIELIVQLAPLAVFGAMSSAIASQGMDALYSLKWLLVAFFIAITLQYVIHGAMIAIVGKLSPFPFYKKIFPIQALAFATSSSKATLRPAMKHIHERIGVSERYANFVLPLGASINMDGTAIYLALATTFFAQMMGIPMGMHEYAMLILSCTIGSIGAAGIPSGSLVFMSVVTGAVGLPIQSVHIGMITAVDSLLDRFRTALNITGDCALTTVISSTENEVDEKVYYS
jgi:Na+/H+-dicarboxylate symporter